MTNPQAYLPKLSGEEIISALEESYQQSLRGKTFSEEDVRGEICAIIGK